MIEKADTGLRRYSVWLLIAILVVVADQLSKAAVIEWIGLYGKVPLNAFINFTHQRNSGAAFSFLANESGWQRWFFVALASAVSIMLLVWLWRIRMGGAKLLGIGLALVLGGALGNLIDRVRFGYVTDFIQVWFGSWAFPSFNVADSAISVGAALLVIDALFVSGRRDRAAIT